MVNRVLESADVESSIVDRLMHQNLAQNGLVPPHQPQLESRIFAAVTQPLTEEHVAPRNQVCIATVPVAAEHGLDLIPERRRHPLVGIEPQNPFPRCCRDAMLSLRRITLPRSGDDAGTGGSRHFRSSV